MRLGLPWETGHVRLTVDLGYARLRGRLAVFASPHLLLFARLGELARRRLWNGVRSGNGAIGRESGCRVGRDL